MSNMNMNMNMHMSNMNVNMSKKNMNMSSTSAASVSLALGGAHTGEGEGMDAQPALVIGRQGYTTISLCTSTGCVTECRCIVPVHYHIRLCSVDQSQEPVVHPWEKGTGMVRKAEELAVRAAVQVDIRFTLGG